jgi:hypothetical protein
MASKAHIFSLFILGALALGCTVAEASRLPTKKAAEESENIEGPLRAPNDDASHNPIKCNGRKDDAASCVGQKDSFERMAQAYSYLGHYMTTQSLYSYYVKDPAELQGIQEAVRDCAGGASCTQAKQEKMVAALIQYNLGKSVKSMILQNNTNRENMKSVPISRQVASNKAHSEATFTSSFKLTARDLNSAASFVPKDKDALSDMDKLGKDFKRDYESFIDTYSSSKGKEKWNLAHEKGKAADAHHNWKIDPATGAPMLVRDRQFYDEDTQGRDPVQNAVKEYKARLSAPHFSIPDEDKKTAVATNATGSSRVPAAAKPKHKPGTVVVDNIDGLRFSDIKLGMRPHFNEKNGQLLNEKQNADAIATKINGQVAAKEKELNEASAKRGDKFAGANVQIDLDNFDKYLDKIWPPTGIQNKTSSQN